MLTTNVLQLLRGGGTVRRYRSRMREWLRELPPLRLLPPLLSIPLMPVGTAGDGIAALLAFHSSFALCGAAGSGRSLALVQLAWHWTASNHRAPLLLLSLPHADAPALSPRAVLARALRATSLPAPLDESGGQARGEAWLLLVDGWEQLPAARREVWRSFLVALPQLWPEAQVVLALPADEAHGDTLPNWPGLQAILFAPPDDERCRQWLSLFQPHHDPQPLLDALKPGSPLAAVRERLPELALLALLYPGNGIPATLAQLYEWGATLLGDDPFQSASARQRSTAWSFAFDTGERFLEHYRLARTLAAEGDGTSITLPTDDARADVARMLVGLLPEPGPLYAALWGGTGMPAPADLLTMGHCLLERPSAAPHWAWRVLVALREQEAGTPQQRLLADIAPALPALLAAADGVGYGDEADALLDEFLPALPRAALVTLVDTPQIRASLRWTAADGLLRLPPGAARAALAAAAPPDETAQAIRCYVLLLGDSADQQALESAEAQSWAAALPNTLPDATRRQAVITALMNAERVPGALHSPLLALLAPSGDTSAPDLLLRLCATSDPAIRAEALTTLRSYEPRLALRVLHDLIFTRETTQEVRTDALEQLAQYQQGEAGALLARCALTPQLPLAAQLRALELLARRPSAGPLLLSRLSDLQTARPAVRAAAARLLGISLARYLARRAAAQRSDNEALPAPLVPIVDALCRVAAGEGPALLRESAIIALGQIGPYTPSQALESLTTAIAQAGGNSRLLITIAQALAQPGVTAAILPLRGLLTGEISERLWSAWSEQVPDWTALPSSQWFDLALADEDRTLLMTLLTEGDSEADQPSSLTQLVEQETLQIQAAAAEALAELGRQTGQIAARSTLRTAIARPAPTHATRRLLACLARASDDAGLHDLSQLLHDPATDLAMRWLVIEQLEQRAASEQARAETSQALLAYLEQALPDAFTGARVIQALGRLGSSTALPTLFRLADQRDGDAYLRTQAIAALGMLNEPAVETTLAHLISSTDLTPGLRGSAAAAMPQHCTSEIRQMLRDLLRHERQPHELVVGILQALGRARDREALPLMLRYAQSEHPDAARAALVAITAIGDASVAPALVRVSQNTLIEHSVRLHAIGCLVQICGEEYVPLLRGYLDSSAPPLQIQALSYLLSVRPDDPYPVQLVAEAHAAPALRLRALEALATRPSDHPALCALLNNPADDEHLRGYAATVLGTHGEVASISALAQCAENSDNRPRLRRRCITALAEQIRLSRAGAPLARLALSRLADDAAQPAENRAWAEQALVRMVDCG